MPENPAVSGPAPANRPWLAIFSFGLIVLAGLLVLTWQAMRWIEARRENARLEAVASSLARLREDHAEAQRQRAATAEARRREGEQAEVDKLRAEAARLRASANEVSQLRAESQRLQAERAAAAVKAGVGAEEDPFIKSRDRARRISCVNNMKQIGLAARIWANAHKDTIPPDLLSLSNELSSPKMLTCPGDTSRRAATTWAEMDGSSVSYEFLSPSVNESVGADVVLARCPLHFNVGLLDGSVQQLDPSAHRIEKVDGQFRVTRVPPPTTQP